MTKHPRLTKLELQIMEVFWTGGELSIREIQEAFPAKARPAYTTVQTTVYRLESKKALKRVRKVGNFHTFAPALSRTSAQKTLIDELLVLLGGSSQFAMPHMITEIAKSIGNPLWQSTLFALCAAGLAFMLRGIPARIRNWIWFAASLKFLVPVSVLLSLGSSLASMHGTKGDLQPVPYYSLDVVSQPFTFTHVALC